MSIFPFDVEDDVILTASVSVDLFALQMRLLLFWLDSEDIIYFFLIMNFF